MQESKSYQKVFETLRRLQQAQTDIYFTICNLAPNCHTELVEVSFSK